LVEAGNVYSGNDSAIFSRNSDATSGTELRPLADGEPTAGRRWSTSSLGLKRPDIPGRNPARTLSESDLSQQQRVPSKRRDWLSKGSSRLTPLLEQDKDIAQTGD